MTSIQERAAALTPVSFEIVAHVGEARSCYIEAVHAARTGDFDRALALKAEGEAAFRKGHASHAALVQREAAGDPTLMTLMLTHAEDQLMSAEGFGILADEFIDVYRAIKESREA